VRVKREIFLFCCSCCGKGEGGGDVFSCLEIS
jgi:hypothetical protein